MSVNITKEYNIYYSMFFYELLWTINSIYDHYTFILFDY